MSMQGSSPEPYGLLPVDPHASRRHQARAFATLDAAATDALVLDLLESFPPEIARRGRAPAPDWEEFRERLITEQGLLQRPRID